MSKDDYSLKLVEKKHIKDLMESYHYLSKEQVTFKSGVNVGLLHKESIVGACIFTGFPVPELAKGCFGLERHEQDGLYELSRFVLEPSHQRREYNLASWFMARSIRCLLSQKQSVRAVLSYADSRHHSGTIYRACNFDYYGLSDKKSDFWIRQSDGTFKKHSRGSVKGIDGEWRPRSRKHRFLKIHDKKLKCLWNKEVN